MSSSNIPAFFEKVQTDPALAAQVATATEEIQLRTAQALARLAAEHGTVFTVEEFLAEQKRLLSTEKHS